MVSARKKKERRKDFVKTKLKVGKDKAKANNHTDTSFVAKSIHLPNQSIAKAANQDGASGSDNSQGGTGLGSERLTHYLSLFRHHSPSTRREAVLYVQNQHVQPILTAAEAALSTTTTTTTTGTPTASGASSNVGNFKLILTAVTPLLTDSDSTVRSAAHDLLKILPGAALAANASFIALYIHAAMTSIDPRVRAKSTLALDTVLDSSAAEPLCRVAFVKLVTSFITMLGWTNAAAAKGVAKAGGSVGANSSAMVVTTSLEFGKGSAKVAVTHLQSFHKLLAAGLQTPAEGDGSDDNTEGSQLKGPQYMTKFLVPSSSMPYLSLALFTKKAGSANNDRQTQKDGGVSITEDVESRVAFLRTHKLTLQYGLETTLKEGGEIGRFAKQIQALLGVHLKENDE